MRHGCAVAGVRGLWCDLVERNQDKGPLSKSWMRKLEACFAEAEVAEHEHIQVQCTGAVGDAGGAVAAEVVFDGEKRIEQGARGEFGFKRNHCVEKARLVGVANRPGGVEPRASKDAAQGAEAVNGSSEGDIGRPRAAREV